ncbi:MAG: glycosyltransferase family 4 protein [Nitrospirota bacterium]
MTDKVVHVITRLDRGGSAQNALLTVLGHDRSRFVPMVVAGMPGRWDDQGGDEATEENRRRLERAGVRCLVLPTLTREINPRKDFTALLRLVALFRAERPAIVHTHTSKAGVLGRLAARLARVPAVVHTPHGHVFYGHFGPVPSWAFLQIERVLARTTTWLIALTEAEREEHLALKVGRPDRFAVIPSGIDLERFRQVAGVAGRRPPGFDCPPDAIVVGSVGWLTPVKGHRVLIEALARLKPAHPTLCLVIVGSGILRAELSALAARLGLRESVRFLGERGDVPDCLAGMDIFVLPSLNEGMGRALIEAMAARRPVVASRVGGVPAVVESRRTGLLVPPNDPEALAAAIGELLRRPDWAKELATAGCESVGERFGTGAMVRAVEAVYEKALEDVRRET